MHPQPSGWLTADRIPVDLMIPEALAGPRSGRAARIPPHHRHATRRAAGPEAAVVDHAPMLITALDPSDPHSTTVAVAGPAALLIAKLHKLRERQASPRRMVDKDTHGIYRLLIATRTDVLATRLDALGQDPLAAETTHAALRHLGELFASSGGGLGAVMAGRAEELVATPATVTAAATALADDRLAAIGADA